MASPLLSPVPYLAGRPAPRGRGPGRHDRGLRLPQTTADPSPGSTRSGPPGPAEPPPVPHPQPPPRPRPPHPAPPPWPPPRPQPEPPAPPPGPRRRRPLPPPEPEPEPEPIPPPEPPPEPCRRDRRGPAQSRRPGCLDDRRADRRCAPCRTWPASSSTPLPPASRRSLTSGRICTYDSRRYRGGASCRAGC